MTANTEHITDEQWLGIASIVNSDADWEVNYPHKAGESVRILTPDGTRIVIQPDGTILRGPALIEVPRPTRAAIGALRRGLAADEAADNRMGGGRDYASEDARTEAGQWLDQIEATA
jgi:hypothetical protein